MDPVSKAQQSENTANSALSQYRGLRPWPKGVSGNPSGRPKKLRVTKMYERLLAKSQNREEIEQSILDELKRKGMAKVLLLREMAERTEGKVADEIRLEGNITLALAETVYQRRKRLNGDSGNQS